MVAAVVVDVLLLIAVAAQVAVAAVVGSWLKLLKSLSAVESSQTAAAVAAALVVQRLVQRVPLVGKVRLARRVAWARW